MLLVATAASAADVLFPQPLHITRQIEDSISKSKTTLHEYCAGNQVITVSGDRVTIADYTRQELTEIDRRAGTYSVTRFEELAGALAATNMTTRRKAAASQATTRTVASDSYEIQLDPATKMELRVDRNVHLSRAALEVLIGASFPNPRSETHDAILRTSVSPRDGGRRIVANAADVETYALPVEQSMTFDVEGEQVSIRNKVLDVRPELAPPGTVTIPPGSQLVEARAVRLARELRELDRLPASPADQR